MSNSNLILLVVLVVVFAIIVFSYLHKRHHEYKMADIEKAVRKAYVGKSGAGIYCINPSVSISGLSM